MTEIHEWVQMYCSYNIVIQEQPKRGPNKKVMEVAPEPYNVEISLSTRVLGLSMMAVVDYSKYSVHETRLRFRDTHMFQTRIYRPVVSFSMTYSVGILPSPCLVQTRLSTSLIFMMYLSVVVTSSYRRQLADRCSLFTENGTLHWHIATVSHIFQPF